MLDLESFEAQQVFWKLVDAADVVVENFSPGTADRLGIGYREVKARKPDIVYCSVSSYGQFGPWKNGRGWERQGQAVAGIMERQDAAGDPRSIQPDRHRHGYAGNVCDGARTLSRSRTGQGQHVQASLCQTATYQQTPYVLDYAGHVVRRTTRLHDTGDRAVEPFLQGAGPLVLSRAARRRLRARSPTSRASESAGLDGEELERSLEDQFARSPRTSGSNV